MPMSPKKGETESKFVSRCTSEMMHSNPDWDNKQAVAACYSMWRRAKGEKDEPPSKSKQLDPDEGEDRTDFMERCVADLVDSGMKRDEAREECALTWDMRGLPDDDGIIHRTHSEPVKNMEFVLSDSSIDRFGDIIAVEGWDIKNFLRNPIALWNHDKNFPIGKWENLRVDQKTKQLRGRLVMAPAGTSPRIDEIRRLIDADILRATSVGFLPKEKRRMEKGIGDGLVFTRSELVETSLVTVPANPNSLALARSLKVSTDTINLVFAEHGNDDQIVRRGWNGNGKHAESNPKRKTSTMSTNIAERIEGVQKRIVGLRDELTEHLKSVDDENPDEAATTLTESLTSKIEALEKSLESYKRAEAHIGVGAANPNGGNGNGEEKRSGEAANGGDSGSRAVSVSRGGAIVVPKPWAQPAAKINPSDHIFRSMVVAVKQHVDRNRRPLESYLVDTYGENETSTKTKAVMDIVTRTAVAPATTFTTGWALELVQIVVADFMERLMPAAVYPGLSGRGLRLTFGRNGTIAIPTRDATPTIAGAFVGEGSAIPVKKGALSSQTLVPKKMGVISTFTRQIAEHSTPSIEQLIRDAMADDTAVALDAVLLDTTAASAIRPPGIRWNVAGLTAATGGGINALIADTKALIGALNTGTNGNIRNPLWMMNPAQQVSIGLLPSSGGDFPFKAEINQNQFQGYPVIVSSTVPSGTVIIIDAADFVSVTGDTPRFDVSDQAVLHEEDTPSALSTAGTPATVAAPARSLWQTDTLAIRMLLDINWALRRTGIVAWTSGVTW